MSMFDIHRSKAAIATAAVTACAVGSLLVPAASAAPNGGATEARTQAAASQEVRKVLPGSFDSRVRGTFGRNGTVRGSFTPDRFVVKRGETYATGQLRATLRRANGRVVGTAVRTVSIPVKNARSGSQFARAGAECDVLNLVLGPLDLNLLGLEVRLNRVVLDIVAVPGAGALLGNLLCAVAGLLDGTGLLNQLRLSNVLNRILGALGL